MLKDDLNNPTKQQQQAQVDAVEQRAWMDEYEMGMTAAETK